MKKILLKSICLSALMVVFAPIGADAQSVVTNISTNDFQACKEYLAAHPQDTVCNGNLKVFVVNGQVVCTAVVSSEPALRVIEKKPAVKVERHGDVTTATYADGTSSTFTRTTSDQISYADKVAVLSGKKMAVKPSHKDVEGNLRHKVYMALLGGVMFVVDDHEFQPMVTLKGGFESCHYLFEVEAQGTWMQYTDSASVAGHHYSSLSLYVGAGWKFWQDARYRSFLAVGGSLGYAYQRTDDKNADVFSDNYGFAGKVWLRGNYPLSNRLKLTGDVGYNLLPKVYHQDHQDHQDMRHGGLYIELGLSLSF